MNWQAWCGGPPLDRRGSTPAPSKGEPSVRSPALIAYAVGGSDLRSKLYSLRAREDARTILERG